jgi:hypothetical protein
MRRLRILIVVVVSILSALSVPVVAQVLRRDTGTGTFTTAPTFPGATSTSTIQTKGLVSTPLDTPVNGTFTSTTGTLNDGSYCYRISALNAAGTTFPSTETCKAVSGGAGSNGVIVTWGAVTGATSYKVYGRTTGTELYVATVTAPTVTWTDNGSVTPSGAMPTVNTSGDLSATGAATVDHLTTTAASGTVALSGVNGSKFCFGASTACITSDGTNYTGPNYSGANLTGTGQVVTPSINSNSQALSVRGGGTDNASAVAITMKSSPDLTTAGAKIITFAPNNANTVKASIDIDGMVQFGIGNTGAAPTCDTTRRGKIWLVNGGTGVTDTVTICLKAAADTYSWVTLTTGG